MKYLVMTGWRGTGHGMMAAHTMPLMEKYALKHGADFTCINLASPAAPPSWMKIPNLSAALDDYDVVLWLDCDVVIGDSRESIFECIDPEALQGVVIHETECGLVPNCGVWMVTQAMRPLFKQFWDGGLPAYRDHPWWEQAVVMDYMGYSVRDNAGWPYSVDTGVTPLREYTTFLDPKWNHHPSDVRRVGQPNFWHITQYADRLGEIRRLCDLAQ